MTDIIARLKMLNEENISKYTIQQNEKELRKQQIISEFLNSPEQFYYMPMEMAYSMLFDLGIGKDEVADIYLKLIR